MCVSGLTTVFAVVTAVWVLSSTSSWDLHQTRLGYWHKEGQKIMKTAQGVNNILGLKKKKILLKEIILLETWASAPSFGHLSKHQQWVLERNLASLGLWLRNILSCTPQDMISGLGMVYRTIYECEQTSKFILRIIFQKIWTLDCTICQGVIVNAQI